MSDAMNLPPLPLRYDLVTRANPETGGYRDVPVYSADDMHAYGEACAAAERERCAMKCDALPLLGNNDTAALWYGRALEDCAAAIRARGET